MRDSHNIWVMWKKIMFRDFQKRFLAIMLVLFLGACTFFRAPGKEDCDKILSREQMADILTEIYILEAFLMEYQYIERRVTDSAKYYYGGIFRHHDVDPDDFDEALDCYLLDEREMDRIHEKMLNRLSIMESEAEQLPEKEGPGPMPEPLLEPGSNN